MIDATSAPVKIQHRLTDDARVPVRVSDKRKARRFANRLESSENRSENGRCVVDNPPEKEL